MPTLLEILSRYLDIVIGEVAHSTLYMQEDEKTQTNAPDNKKMKIVSTETNKLELEYRALYRRHIHVCFEMLDIIDVGHKDDPISMVEIIKLTQLTVKYFFWSMIEEGNCNFPILYEISFKSCLYLHLSDTNKRLVHIKRSLSMLGRLCVTRKFTRITALRELLEGALYTYGNLFGAQNDVETPAAIKISSSTDVSLMKMNQMQNAASTVRGTLHAGTIGSGLKTPAKESLEPQSDARDMLLKAITACCKSDVSSTTDQSLKPIICN